jgi:hypothetical protein
VPRSTALPPSGQTAILAATIGLIVGLSALLARIGSDAQWLAALGHVLVARHTIPAGVPFASSPTGHWPNPLVLAELIFYGLEHGFGDRGLMVAQLLAVAAAMIVLARDARAGGADGVGTSGALLLAAFGAISSLAIVRVQLFSLVLFPVLIAVLRAQGRAPSRRIWLVVPLLALWSNLHGAALLGLGIVVAYLLLERGRREPLLAVAVAAASAAALCVTPALARTVDYYHGVLTNTAAQRGQGMWAHVSLHSPFDVVLAAAAALAIVRMWRSGAPRWEWAVVAALAVLTVRADRDGVWLMFFVVGPAARKLAPARSLRTLAPIMGLAAVALIGLAVVRGPVPSGATVPMVNRAVALAHGSPVLADGSIDEQIALAGGRIWAGNPIDAFSVRVQSAYLYWLAGDARGRAAVTPAVQVVLVSRGSDAQKLMARTGSFTVARADATTVLYERGPVTG